MLILGWIIGSFIVAAICSNKKFGFWGTFFISLLFSPVIGLIAGLLSGDPTPEKPAQIVISPYKKHYDDAQRFEFKQRYKEAIDKYQDFLFDVSKNKEKRFSKEDIVIIDNKIKEVNERIDFLKTQKDGESLTE